MFMNYPGRAWSDYLLEQVWGPNFTGGTKTLDVHIRWLRQKLSYMGNLSTLERYRGLVIGLAESPVCSR